MKTLNHNQQLMKHTVSLLISFLENELNEDIKEESTHSNPQVNKESENEQEHYIEEEEEDEFEENNEIYTQSQIRPEEKPFQSNAPPEREHFNTPLKVKFDNTNYPQQVNTNSFSTDDYPIHGKLLEKVLYLSQKNPGFWCSREIVAQIEKIEGHAKAEETLKSFRQKLHNFVQKNALVSIMLGNNKQMMFYGLKDWIDKKTMSIKNGLNPKPQYLRGLSKEELQRINLSWNGL